MGAIGYWDPRLYAQPLAGLYVRALGSYVCHTRAACFLRLPCRLLLDLLSVFSFLRQYCHGWQESRPLLQLPTT